MMTWASTRCKSRLSALSSRLSATALLAFLLFAGLSARVSSAQMNSPVQNAPTKVPVTGSALALHASSTMNVASEMGGAIMSGSKCDADGNLYIRKYAMDRPLLGPVVKIDRDGKRIALFDPAAFSQLALDRADAFSPASDGGMYQIAQSGVLKPRIYVLHFSSDGSVSSPVRLNADFEVYTFAAFADGNFLLSGVKRDVRDKNDRGRNFTAAFSSDGRELAQLAFQEPAAAQKKQNLNDAEKAAPILDLAEAEVGSDGNLYVMRGSSPALVYVIAPTGEIVKTFRVASPLASSRPSAFHVSGNRLAISFQNEDRQSATMVVAEAQTGRKIASYDDAPGLGTTFACYSANEGVFTFVKLGEANSLELIRAEAQ